MSFEEEFQKSKARPMQESSREPLSLESGSPVSSSRSKQRSDKILQEDAPFELNLEDKATITKALVAEEPDVINFKDFAERVSIGEEVLNSHLRQFEKMGLIGYLDNRDLEKTAVTIDGSQRKKLNNLSFEYVLMDDSFIFVLSRLTSEEPNWTTQENLIAPATKNKSKHSNQIQILSNARIINKRGEPDQEEYRIPREHIERIKKSLQSRLEIQKKELTDFFDRNPNQRRFLSAISGIIGTRIPEKNFESNANDIPSIIELLDSWQKFFSALMAMEQAGSEIQILETFGYPVEFLTDSRDKLNGNSHLKSKKHAQAPGGAIDFRRDAKPEEQCLNADKQAEVLSEFFANTVGDLNFGLFGHWGRGKTHLMKLIGDRLKARYQYDIVEFSAWKYRSNPEIWAYLYETFAERVNKSHVLQWFFTPLRANLAKYGNWPIVWLMISICFFVVGWKNVENLFFLVSDILGISSLALSFRLYFKKNSLQKKILKILQTTSHSDSLGSQASIGNDLKALLTGWIPLNFWYMWKFPKFIAGGQSQGINFWRFDLICTVIYLTCVVLVPILLFFEPGRIAQPLIINASISTMWIVLMFGYPLLAFNFFQGPRQVLLVVDDLDRCRPKEMLEIVESIMLFLDDLDIRRRLQIAMLVEESTIVSAIERKYEHLFTVDGKVDLKKRVTVVQENIEKIFLAHFRLPETNKNELRELFDRFITAPSTPPKERSTRIRVLPEELIDCNDTHKNEDLESEQPQATIDSSEREKSGERNTEIDSQPSAPKYDDGILMSQSEKEEIMKIALEIHEVDLRWGPRSVRCFINKYQIARAIFRKLLPEAPIDPKFLVEGLLSTDFSLEFKNYPYWKQVASICEQIK